MGRLIYSSVVSSNDLSFHKDYRHSGQGVWAIYLGVKRNFPNHGLLPDFGRSLVPIRIWVAKNSLLETFSRIVALEASRDRGDNAQNRSDEAVADSLVTLAPSM